MADASPSSAPHATSIGTPEAAATIEALEREIAEFNRARDWGPTHTPAALAAALSVEAAELVSCFLWQSPEEQLLRLGSADTREPIEEELADIAIYLLNFTSRYKIDLPAVIRSKLKKNAARYPAP